MNFTLVFGPRQMVIWSITDKIRHRYKGDKRLVVQVGTVGDDDRCPSGITCNALLLAKRFAYPNVYETTKQNMSTQLKTPQKLNLFKFLQRERYHVNDTRDVNLVIGLNMAF